MKDALIKVLDQAVSGMLGAAGSMTGVLIAGGSHISWSLVALYFLAAFVIIMLKAVLQGIPPPDRQGGPGV